MPAAASDTQRCGPPRRADFTDTGLPQPLQLADTGLPPLQANTLLRQLPGRREVFAGHWGEQAVVIKRFCGRRARRYWQREQQGCLALQRAGLATPQLCYSGLLVDGSPVLLFEHLPQPQSALACWQQATSDSERLALLGQLISLIGQGHHQGLLQTDLHLENFLLSNGRLYAIDGDGIRQRRAPLRERLCRDNLALLLAQLPCRHDGLLAEVLPLYGLARQQPLAADFAAQLRPLLDRARRRRRQAYVKKASRSCSEFVRQQRFSQLALYRRDAESAALQAFLHDPDAFVQGAPLYKDGNSATVAWVTTAAGDWVIKRYNIKGFWHGLSRGLRPSRALISWRNAHRLVSSGIATPQAIALLEKRFGLWRRSSYYVTARCDGESAAQLDGTQLPQQQSRITSLVDLFRQFHQLGIRHGDCKASNFLLQGNTVQVIDLDALTEYRWRWLFLRRYAADRQRFLRNWPVESPLRRHFDRLLP
ncbi:lipopolysaccharide kinase InaA family protein [Desulfuromonas thiophila]|uniref:Lipopolysaccharide kinase (Kdo/WaaP) family protein n=1 Tax=Desulfuromonas thiophila TaxID=57664 RepID=A0A1G7BTA3_9BACT|nr:lipopolysaccharide kinase InaA family protein [Desulfuromonas thiophila]SDE30227.1 Lipopolysaccharide kinase (Kdo/WaaP) family protein [Desulfuromonas thiophila]